MSKFHCPWKFSLQVGHARLPLHLHHEEDLLGSCADDGVDADPHSLFFSTDVSETEWSGALNDTERLAMFDARMNSDGDEEQPLFSLLPGESLPAQLYVSGPGVHSAETSDDQEQPVGHPVRLVCSPYYNEDNDGARSFNVKSHAAAHELGFAPLTVSASADEDGRVVAVDAFFYPERIKMGSPARMLVDAFRVHNIIASCVEADALLDGTDTSELATMPAEAFGGAMRAAGRGIKSAGRAAGRGAKKAGSAAARGAKKVGGAVRRGARAAGSKARSAGRSIKGGASKLGGKARSAVSARIIKARGGLSKLKSGGLRTQLKGQLSKMKSSVGNRVSQLRDKAGSKFSSLREKVRSRRANKKAADPAKRGKIKSLLNKFRNRGKGGQSGSGGAAGGGPMGGGGDDSGGGGDASSAAMAGGGGGGGVEPVDGPLVDPAVAAEPAPPLPPQPTALNQAQETMLESAVNDGLIAPEQLTAIRASGVSAATVSGIPPSVVSALVVRNPQLQQAVVNQVQRVDPQRLLDYRRAAVGPLQMTIAEREQYLANGIAPARMILPSAPQPDELSYAPAYVPGQTRVAREPDEADYGDDDAGEEAPALIPRDDDAGISSKVHSDGSVSMPRAVLDFLLEEARQQKCPLPANPVKFEPEPAADTVRLQPAQLARLLKLADDLERKSAEKEPAEEDEQEEDEEEEEEEEEEDEEDAEPAPATEPDKETALTPAEEQKERLETEMELESQDVQACVDAFAELIGLADDDGDAFDSAAAAASDDVDALQEELPAFVNRSDTVPLSALLMCTQGPGRTSGTAGAMEFAYHLVAPKGEFVDTKLYHAMEAAGDVDTLFEPTTSMDYAQLGAYVKWLAAAVSRQIHNPPAVCPAHGAQCHAH
jgi:hypothetical protein